MTTQPMPHRVMVVQQPSGGLFVGGLGRRLSKAARAQHEVPS
jgi:hypothetical protein